MTAACRQLTRDHNQIEERAQGAQEAPTRPCAVRLPMSSPVRSGRGHDRNRGWLAQVLDGDMFMLCSDGLSNALSDQLIAQSLLRAIAARPRRTLLELALATGGRDNITAVVVRADDLSGPNQTTIIRYSEKI